MNAASFRESMSPVFLFCRGVGLAFDECLGFGQLALLFKQADLIQHREPRGISLRLQHRFQETHRQVNAIVPRMVLLAKDPQRFSQRALGFIVLPFATGEYKYLPESAFPRINSAQGI